MNHHHVRLQRVASPQPRQAANFTAVALVLMVFTVFAGMTGLPQVAKAGAVTYPALGHLELEEGTIELWLTPMTELYPDIEGFRRGFSLFSLDVPEHFAFSGMWASNNGSHGPHVSMSSRRQERGLIPVPGRAVDWWKQGEPAHIALTWKGREMSLIADGRRVGHRRQGLAFTGELVNAMLVVGDARSRDNHIVLHALRVSNIARTPDSLVDAEPKADLFTLLLDRYEQLETDRDGAWSVPQVASHLDVSDVEPRGRLRGQWHRVKQPRPGVALYPEP